MASPMPLLSIIFAIGMVLGGAILALLPLAPERGKPLVTSVRVADLAAPCKRQTSAKDELRCAARAPQRNEIAKPAPEIKPAHPADAVEVASQARRPEFAAPLQPLAPLRTEVVARAKAIPAVSPSPGQRVATAFAQLPPVIASIAMSPAPADSPPLAAEAADVPRPVERAKAEPARAARHVGGAIPVIAVAANGRRRTIVIRPTSQQDVYYYAARRQLAAASTQPR